MLGVADVVSFFVLRYGLEPRTAKRRATQWLRHVDADGSGRVDFAEFQAYSRKNPIFLAMAHYHQTKLRTAVLGQEYWRERFDAVAESRLERHALPRWPQTTTLYENDFKEVCCP